MTRFVLSQYLFLREVLPLYVPEPFQKFVKIKKINLFYPFLFSNIFATMDSSFQFNECCLNCFVSAIVEVYKNEGNEVCLKGDFLNASHFYTEGIKVKCGNKELKAKLYNNRATVHFKLGKNWWGFNLFGVLRFSTWQLASLSSRGTSCKHVCV